MKKFLAMLLASTMVLGLSVPAFAANEATADADSENKATIDVTGKYEEEYIDADTVISVDVAWDSMEFTYAANGYQGEWNPGDHSYSGGNSGGWVKNTSDITVTNHSNAEVTAAFTFAKDDAFSDGEVEFKQNDSVVTAVDLATAVGTTKENAPKQTVTFAITAGSIAANGNLGTITVAISEKKSEAKLQLATTYYYVSATASAEDMDMSKAVFRYVDEKEQRSEITGATDGVTIVTTGKKGNGQTWNYITNSYVQYTTEEFTVTYKKLTATFTVYCYTSTPPQLLPSDVSALPPVDLTKE